MLLNPNLGLPGGPGHLKNKNRLLERNRDAYGKFILSYPIQVISKIPECPSHKVNESQMKKYHMILSFFHFW